MTNTLHTYAGASAPFKAGADVLYGDIPLKVTDCYRLTPNGEWWTDLIHERTFMTFSFPCRCLKPIAKPELHIVVSNTSNVVSFAEFKARKAGVR
jgi:hypothetical protein